MVSIGLIPAHAGKTRGHVLVTCARVAHPRSRGENMISTKGTAKSEGSSPLTRGKLEGGDHLRPIRGLIPAHAGKTFQAELEMVQERAHPRSRGENPSLRPMPPPIRGSSPLTRGKHLLARQWDVLEGLIPAHAGKTPPGWMVSGCRRAHPRSRGENGGLSAHRLIGEGSSPLTRGKLPPREVTAGHGGLIPAHAGKTLPMWPAVGRLRAHPRSRGENPVDNRQQELEWGSSPLTRGKLSASARHGPRNGLIPAHAGKTGLPGCVSKNAWAHPRSRGENAPSSSRAGAQLGSSPLTRGKRGRPI